MLIKAMSNAGVRSEHAYTAAVASIGLSVISWFISKTKEDASLARADRWGIFVGQWAPTLFGMGLALKGYEDDSR